MNKTINMNLNEDLVEIIEVDDGYEIHVNKILLYSNRSDYRLWMGKILTKQELETSLEFRGNSG